MEFQAPPPTTFIPRKAIPLGMQRRASSGIFLVIATIVFLASLATFAGFYFYKKNLEQETDRLTQSVARSVDQQNKFKGDTLSLLSIFDSKMVAARDLLNRHSSLLPIFDMLEGLTLQTIRFKSFKFDEAPDGKITVRMAGEAKGYASIALQSASFSKAKNVSDTLFTDLNLDQFGNVIFNFSATLNPSFISYRENRSLGI